MPSALSLPRMARMARINTAAFGSLLATDTHKLAQILNTNAA